MGAPRRFARRHIRHNGRGRTRPAAPLARLPSEDRDRRRDPTRRRGRTDLPEHRTADARAAIRHGADFSARQADSLEPAGQAIFPRLDKRAPVEPSPTCVEKKLVGSSQNFPRALLADYAASLLAIARRLVYERLNSGGSQVRVEETARLNGKPVLVLTSTDDFDHPRALAAAIVDWLNAAGAKAEYLRLADRGIEGKGHMLMLDDNSDAIADVMLDRLARLIGRWKVRSLRISNSRRTPRLGAIERFGYSRRLVTVMVDNLPSAGLPTIDIRDPRVHRKRLSGNRELSMLDTHFVGGVPGDPDQLIRQCNPTARACLGHLIEGLLDLIPSDSPIADRVHRRHCRTVRPDISQRSCIASKHAVQGCIKFSGGRANLIFSRHEPISHIAMRSIAERIFLQRGYGSFMPAHRSRNKPPAVTV